MQKVVFLIITCFMLITCDKKDPIVDGFYYNKRLEELMVVENNGKKVEIYNILLYTSYHQDTLKYQCLECPNGETIIHLQQTDGSNIKVAADYKEANINSRIYRKLENNAFPWDSLKICTTDSCLLFFSNINYKEYLYNRVTEFNLDEEIRLVTNPNFIFYHSVTDSEPVEITIYYSNKDKLIRNTKGLQSYLSNLGYIVNICLSDDVQKKSKWCCGLLNGK